MAEVVEVVQTAGGEMLSFYCPGCRETHMVRTTSVAEGTAPVWQWNRSLTSPTLTPSVLLRTGHYMEGHRSGDACWCTYNRDNPTKPAPFACVVCHSFVTDGQIQFLGDCTHALAGQTVPLAPDPREKSGG